MLKADENASSDWRPPVILIKYEPVALRELLEVSLDPDTGKPGLSQARFAALCKLAAQDLSNQGVHLDVKISQKTVSNWLNGVHEPNMSAATVMGKVLGVIFVPDWARITNNDHVIGKMKSPLNKTYHPRSR